VDLCDNIHSPDHTHFRDLEVYEGAGQEKARRGRSGIDHLLRYAYTSTLLFVGLDSNHSSTEVIWYMYVAMRTQ
jgi:hypothetical protein